MIAIFLVAVGITGLQLHGAEPWITPVFNGSVLLLAVAVSNVAATQRVLVRARGAILRRRAPAGIPGREGVNGVANRDNTVIWAG